MLLRSDLHVHSADFSGDAVTTMEQMCRKGISLGLERICFTDHVDFDPHYDDSIPFNIQKYDDAIAGVQDKYGSDIEILKGIEVGEPHKYPKEYEKLLNHSYDMIIASIHYIDIPMGLHWTGDGGRDIFTFAVERIYRRYYEEIFSIVKLGGFDVLGHFDYPKRYLKQDAKEDKLIGEIIETMVKQGILMEINTSPWRGGCKEPAPAKSILTAYKKAGGKRLVIGSDAHDKAYLGSYLDDALALAEEFDVGYFKNRSFHVI